MADKNDHWEDFEDDDDFRFDDLDAFDSDIDSAGGATPPIDSTTDRSPISKTRAVFDKVKPVLAGVSRAAVSRLTRRVSDEFPETSSLVDEGLNIATDVVRLKNEFTKDIEPTVNQLKSVGRRLAPRIQPVVPPSVYDKLMARLEATDHGGKDVNVESQRDEALAESMRSIFAATMELDKSKQKDTAVNAFIDRRLSASRHTELTTLVGDIRAVTLNQYAFNQKVNIPYMKKMLELKYQHIWVSKDILKVLTTYSETSQGKLEEIRHNTSLPDSQKEFLSEKYKDKMRERIVTSIGDYVSEFGKNILTNIQEQVLGPGKSLLETAGDIGEQFVTGMEMEDEMLEMEGKKKPSFKQGLVSTGAGTAAKWLAGLGGGAVGAYASDKLDPYRDDILNFTGNTKTNTAFMLNRLRGKMTDSDSGLLNALGALIPELDKSAGRIKNTAFSDAMAPTAFDMATRTSIVEVIPSLLSGIYKQITELNTGKPAPEYTYDFKQRKMVTTEAFTTSMESSIFGTEAERTEALRSGIAPIRAQLKRIGHKEAVTTFDAVADEVATVFYNLAQWKDYPVLQPEAFKDYDSQTEPTEVSAYMQHALRGVKHPRAVVELIVTALYKSDGTLNRSTYLAWTRAIQKYMTEYSERYKSLLGGYIDAGASRHMTGIFADQTDTDDFVIDADKLRTQFTKVDGTSLRDTTESDDIAAHLASLDSRRASVPQTPSTDDIPAPTASQKWWQWGTPEAVAGLKTSALKHSDSLMRALKQEQADLHEVMDTGTASKWYDLFSRKVLSPAEQLKDTVSKRLASGIVTPGYTDLSFPSVMHAQTPTPSTPYLVQTDTTAKTIDVTPEAQGILETISSNTTLMVTSLKEIAAHTEAGVYVTAGVPIPEQRKSLLGKLVSAPWAAAKWGIGTAATLATSPFRLMGKLFGKQKTTPGKGYTDVYRQDTLDTPLATVKQFTKGLCYEDGSPVTDSYSIGRPVYDPSRDINGNPRKQNAPSAPLCVITQEDIDAGLVDNQNHRLSKPGGTRGASGEKGFVRRAVGGLLSVGGHAAKGLFSMEWAVAKAAGSTALGVTKRLLFPYCDVYTRDPSGQFILLCRGGDLKKFGVYRDGKHVTSSYEITGPVFHLLTNDLIISPEDIAQGLYDGTGTSLSTAGSVLGNIVAAGARTVAGAAKIALKVPMWALKAGYSTLRGLVKGKNPYIDVFKRGAIDPEHPLLRGDGIRRGLYCFSDGERVTSAYKITEPVYEVSNGEVGNCLITNEDLMEGLVDIHNDKLTAWNGKSALGKVAAMASGAASWMLNTTAGIGKGLFSGLSSLFTGLFGGVFSSDGKLQLANRTDIKELVGDKLDVIIAMLDQRLELPEQTLIDRDGYTKLGTVEEARAIKDGRIALPGGKDDPDSILGPNADVIREETEEEAEIQETVAMRIREKERKALAKKGLDRNGQYLRKGGDGDGDNEEGGILSSIAGLLWTVVKGMGYTAIAMKIPEIWDSGSRALSWMKDTNLVKNVKENFVKPFASTNTGKTITNTVSDLATSTGRVAKGAVDTWRNSGLYKGLKTLDKMGNLASKGTMAYLGYDAYSHMSTADDLEKMGEFKQAAGERGSVYGGIAGAAAGSWMLRGNGAFRLAGMVGGYYAGGMLGETILSAYGSGYEKFAVGESSTGKSKLQFTLFNLRAAAYGTTDNRACTEALVDQLEAIAYESFLTKTPLTDEEIRDLAVAMDMMDDKHPTLAIKYWRKWWSERFLPVYFIYMSALEMAGVTMDTLETMTQEQCVRAFTIMETNYTKNERLNRQKWLLPTKEGYKKYTRSVEAGIYEDAEVDENYAYAMKEKGIEDPDSLLSGKNVALAATTGYIARGTKYGKAITNKAGGLIADSTAKLLSKSAAGRTVMEKAGGAIEAIGSSKAAKGLSFLGKYGSKFLKAGPMTVLLQGGIAGIQVKEELDKGRTDQAVERGITATASIAGTLAGATYGTSVGAAIGAGIGSFAFGIGAVPGAWIGGLLGSVVGGYFGSEAGVALISPLAKRMGTWFTDESGPGLWGKPRFQWGCFKYRAQLYGIEHPDNFEDIIDTLEKKAYALLKAANTPEEARGFVDGVMDWFSGNDADLELMDIATAFGINAYKHPKEAVSFVNAWYRMRFLPVFFDYLTLLKELNIDFNNQEDITEEQAGIILSQLDEKTSPKVEPMTNLVPTDDAFKKWVDYCNSPEGKQTTFSPDTEKARAALGEALNNANVATLGTEDQQLKQDDYIVAMNFAGKIKSKDKSAEETSDAAHRVALDAKYGTDRNKSQLEKVADTLGVSDALATGKELTEKGLQNAKELIDDPSKAVDAAKDALKPLTEGMTVATLREKASALYTTTTENLNTLVEGKDLSVLNPSQKDQLLKLKDDLLLTGNQLLENPEAALGTLAALGGTITALGKDMGSSAMDATSTMIAATQAKLSPQFDKLLAGGTALVAAGTTGVAALTDAPMVSDAMAAVKQKTSEVKEAVTTSPLWQQATAALTAVPPMEEAKQWLMIKAEALEDQTKALYQTGKAWLLPDEPQRALDFMSRIVTALLGAVDAAKRADILGYLKQPGGFCDTVVALQDKLLKGEPITAIRDTLQPYLTALQLYISECLQMDLPTFCRQCITVEDSYKTDPDGADRTFLDHFGLSYATYTLMDTVCDFSQTVKQQAKDLLESVKQKGVEGIRVDATTFGKDALSGLLSQGASLLDSDAAKQAQGYATDAWSSLKQVGRQLTGPRTVGDVGRRLGETASSLYTAVQQKASGAPSPTWYDSATSRLSGMVGGAKGQLAAWSDDTKTLLSTLGVATSTMFANGLRFEFKSSSQALLDTVKTKLDAIPDLADVQDWFTGMKGSLLQLTPQEWSLYRLRCFLYGIQDYEESQGIITKLEELTLSFFEKIQLPRDGSEPSGYLDTCLSKFHTVCGFDNPEALDTLLLGFAYSFGLDVKGRTKEAIHFMRTWYQERFIPSLRLVDGTLASVGATIVEIAKLTIEQCAAIIKQLKDFATQNSRKMHGLDLSTSAFTNWCQETYGKLVGDLTPGIEKAYADIEGMRATLSESARDIYDSLKDVKLKNVIDGVAQIAKPLGVTTAHASVPSVATQGNQVLSPGQQAAVGATASSVGSQYTASSSGDASLGMESTQAPSVSVSGLKNKGLGSVTAIFESNGNSSVIAWDSTGGTSYGKYQFGSRPGGLAAFIRWAMTVPEGKALATRMISAIGPLASSTRGDAGWGDTGSKRGAAVDAWKAAVAAGEVGDLEDRYFNELVLPRALNTLSKKNPIAAKLIQPSRALMEMFHSLNIQHGEGGARRVLSRAVERLGAKAATATPEDLVNAVYDIRGNFFGSSTARIQRAAQNRFRKERPIILGLLKEEQNGTTQTAEGGANGAAEGAEMPSTSPNGQQAAGAADGGAMSVTAAADGATATPPVSQSGAVQDATAAVSSTPSVASGVDNSLGAQAGTSPAPVDAKEGEESFQKLKLQPGVEVSGLLPAMKSALGKLNAEFMEMFHTPLIITSGSRSLQKQAQLYRTGGSRKAAAPKATSPHVAGYGVDIDRNQATKAASAGLLKKYGLWRPFWPNGSRSTEPEEWHTELEGIRNANFSIDKEALNEYANGKEPTEDELKSKPTVVTASSMAQDLKGTDPSTKAAAMAAVGASPSVSSEGASMTTPVAYSPTSPTAPAGGSGYIGSSDTGAVTPVTPSVQTQGAGPTSDTAVTLLQMQLEQSKLMAASLASINTNVATIAQRQPSGVPSVQPVSADVSTPAGITPVSPGIVTPAVTGTRSQAFRQGQPPVSVSSKTYI